MRILSRPAALAALLVAAVPALVTAQPAGAAEVPGAGVLSVETVAPGVHAIVGPMEQRSPENLGNNATFGAVETDAGVVLIDSGAGPAAARALEAALGRVTDAPVTVVINTGGQDHRWLGNGYFKDKGARIIASEAAVADQENRFTDQAVRLRALVGDDFAETLEPVTADETFTGEHRMTVGGVDLVLEHAAPAHTPGDAHVWLPGSDVVFSGDIVYMDRMLGVGSQSNSRSWIEAFDAMAARDPAVVVPGHGHPGSLEKARAETRDYLTFLREKVGAVLDSGGGAIEAARVPQEPFMHLRVAEQIAGRNAQQVYTEMEWE